MTEKDKKADTAPENATGDRTQDSQTEQERGSNEAPITINAQYIRDLSFEHPNPLKNFEENPVNPEININIDVAANNMKERTFEVVLTLRAEATRKEEIVFVTELEYAGVFTLASTIPQENYGPVLMIECPRLLFPYARAIISNTTRDGGFPPLSLNPIDFAGLYRRQIMEQQQKQEKENSSGEKTGSTQ